MGRNLVQVSTRASVVKGKDRPTAIIRGAQLIGWDVLSGLQDLLADVFWRLDVGALRVDETEKRLADA